MSITKSVIFTALAICLALTVQSQIKNSNWKVKPVEGYSFTFDTSVKHSELSSLKLTSKENKAGTYMSFSQVVPITVNHLKRILLTAYIKCADVQTESTLWCQIWDKNDKMIGFQNLGATGVKIFGTSDWKKYSMTLTVNAKAKKLLLGGYLSGTGTAWFDDFSIEEPDENAGPPSAVVTSYIKEFTGIVKQNSIFADSLNWTLLEKDIAGFSRGLKTVAEARSVADYVIQELRAVGDNHSFIQNKVAAEQYGKGNSNPEKVQARLLPGNIGYVSVPGFSSTNAAVSVQFATDIQQMIRDLDSKNKINGWVVDLRGNTGGNMYPMIAGLGPLTGEGTLGHFIKMVDEKELTTPWFYRKGGSGAGSGTSVQVLKPYSLKNKAVKVAVLIGPKTSSSGEMTAISFIGKPNAKLFGVPSGGYTTGNGMFRLSDGSNLLLASSYTADRNMKRYMKRISPDVVVTPVGDGNDADLKAAEDWLLKAGK